MSWYNNNNESSFQDATQIQLGGSGGSSSTTIIQNGDNVGIGGTSGNLGSDTTINDLISLRFDNPNYNVYITNNNPNGLIYFRTSDNNNKIKIENGALYVWYDYNPFISLLITSGWTHISDYIVTTRQGELNNAVNIGVLDVAVLAPVTGLVSRVTIMEPILASTTANSLENTSRIVRLELDAGFEEPSQLEFDNALTSGVDQLRGELGTNSTNFMNMVQSAGYQGGNARNLSSLIRKSNFSLAQAFFTNFFTAIGGLSFVVGISYQLYDRWRDTKLYDEEKNLILTYEKIKNEPDASVANLIHKNGLIITQSTNNNFTNAGTYEVNTSNNCVLIIIIKSVSGTLTAEIDSVKETGTGFVVNDVISIPKSSIGGTTGNLEIVVSTLYSEVQILAFDLDLISEERDQLVNRNRRRQFIPDKNDFGNGLNITETNNTEPSGEITKALDISLKLDTGQFAYDGSGNLQLTNYNNLIYTNSNGSVGINTSSPSPLVKLDCKGSAEFGDGVNINQGINIKSLNGYYILGSDNSGNNGTNNNQFYIYDVNDLTYRLTIQNDTGRVGIGTNLPQYKLHVNGDLKCEDVNCDDIVCDKIGINTSTNHTGTLLDVRGFASFGDSITAVQAISLRSQSGLWNITSDNNGLSNNNQFVISSLRTISGTPNVETKFILIDNITTYVGIGKTPSYKLDVDGDVNITGNFRVNGSIFPGSNWTTTNLVDIKYNTGAVGINIGSTTIPLGLKLDARGNVRVGDGVTASQSIWINSSLGSFSWGSDNSGGGTDGSGTFNGNQFYIYDNHNTSYIMTAQRTTGNVGIGNANRYSSYKLDVDGDINIKAGSKYKINGVNLSYANLDNLLFTALDANTLAVNGGVLSVIGGGGTSQWTTTGNHIYYNTGSVLINHTTANTNYKLDVNGNVNISSGSKYKIGGSDLSYNDIAGTAPTSSQWTTTGNDIYYGGSGSKVGIGMIPTYQLDVDGNCRINGSQYITGNLGIGVQSPNQKLEVNGALYLTGSPTNPGNNSSASFWNQAGVGATISGYNFAVNTNGTTEAMRIDHFGNIGIGFTPNRRLDITDGTTITNSSASYTSTLLRCVGGLGNGKHNGGKAGIECCHSNGSAGIQLGYNGIGQTGNGTSYGVNIYSRGAIICNMINNSGTSKLQMNDNGNLYITGNYSTMSDIRIKENVRYIDDGEALNKILALQPKKYEYIDKHERGDKSVIGFIAQQVKEVIPEAIQISEKLLPNVLEWYDYIDGKLYINIPEITIGTKINFRTNEDKNEGDTLKVKEKFEDYIIFDDEDGMMALPSEDIKKLFVFGYEVKDFHMLDKAMIFTTNVSATQELHKIIMEQKEEINLLKEILARNGIV